MPEEKLKKKKKKLTKIKASLSPRAVVLPVGSQNSSEWWFENRALSILISSVSLDHSTFEEIADALGVKKRSPVG